MNRSEQQICGGWWHGTLVLCLLMVLPLLLTTPANAQGLGEEARSVLRQGQQAAAQAMVTYPDHFPDQPLWNEAITLGQRAQRLAPERPEPYRFLGQVYSVTGWYSRAWDAWQSYLDLGGEMDAQARSQLLAAATWLGFNSYSNDDYRRAIPYLEQAYELNPEDLLTLRRLTQSYLELGDVAAARTYAERLAALDENSSALLDRVEAYMTYGVEAVEAVRQGESLYAEGRQADALRQFARAVELNPDYPEALESAGQTALEMGRAEEAVGYFQQLVELDPGNDGAQSALALARNRAQFGEQAFAAYSDGLAAYEQGDSARAEELLLEALAENPRIAEAHALLGRIDFARGDFEQSLARFQRAAELAPEESSYRFYISAAEEQVREARALAAERAQEEAAARARAEEAARLAQLQREAEARARAAAAAAEQAAAEQAAAEQAAAEQAAAEQAAAERAAAEQAAAEQEAAAAQAAAERAAAEQAAAEQAAAEQAAAEQAAADQAAEERAAELAAAEQAAAEQAAAEQAAAEEATAEQAAAEQATAEQPAEDEREVQQTPGAQAAALPQTRDNQVAGAALPAEPTQQPVPSGVLTIANETITHRSAEEGGSGAFSFLPGENLETNLVSPVNFAAGTLYQRLEVRSKPSDVPVHYQLCLVPNDSIAVQPACTASNLLVFDEEGVFEAQQELSSLSGFSEIDWSNGLESVILVIKDPSGVPVDSRYLLGDGTQQPPDPELYYPMEVEFTAVVVPEGTPFPGWPQ